MNPRHHEGVTRTASSEAAEAVLADRRARALGTRPAPPLLQPVQALVNTRNAIRGYDLLEDVPSAQLWLAAEAPAGVEPELTTAGWTYLLTVRESLRAVLLTHTTGQAPSKEALDV